MEPTAADTGIERELGKHFELPAIRRVDVGRPFAWLALGWRDLRANAPASLSYGVLIAALGWLIWWIAGSAPQPLTASVTVFFLLAPLLAAGLYEISRRAELGLATGFGQSLQAWRRSGGALAPFGVELVILAIFWERLSAILFALTYGGHAPDVQAFFRDAFLSGNYPLFAFAYVGVGAVFALIVFVVSAVSIPMLLDRNGDFYTAMATSFLAVSRNFAPMLVWAVLIVALMAVGFATMLVGLVVIFPLLGHATWHAYRETTRWDGPAAA
jgi:uncharacterized membrane protein